MCPLVCLSTYLKYLYKYSLVHISYISCQVSSSLIPLHCIVSYQSPQQTSNESVTLFIDTLISMSRWCTVFHTSHSHTPIKQRPSIQRFVFIIIIIVYISDSPYSKYHVLDYMNIMRPH